MNGETIKTGRSSEDKIIEINCLHKWFGDLHVLNDISLNVFRGERIEYWLTGLNSPATSRTSKKSAKRWAWSFSISTFSRT
jgi:hypothetical protein